MDKKFRVYNILIRHWFIFSIAAISFIMLLCMVDLSGKQGFWLDELYQIGFIHKGLSLADTIKIYATLEEVSPPLFGVASYIWYRIVPNGQRWLLLICEIPVAISVFMSGLIARKLWGNRSGILAAIFSATSRIYLYDAGQEFRMYGFLVFFSTLTLWFYINRIDAEGKLSGKNIVFFGISMALMVLSHYMAAIICLALFISDAYLFIRKKIKFKFIISYFLAFALFLPWAITVLLNIKRNISSFWPKTPELPNLLNIFKYMLSHNQYMLILFFIGVSAIVYILFNSAQNKDFNYKKHFILVNSVWTILFYMSVLFVYSRFINPEGSIFVDRYFLCVVPYVILICAYSAEKLLDYLSAAVKSKAAGSVALVFVVIFFFYNGYLDFASSLTKIKNPYREAAGWIAKQNEILSPDTAVFLNDPTSVAIGWKELYFDEFAKNAKAAVLHPDNNSTADFREKIEKTDHLIEAGKYKKIYYVNMLDRSLPDYFEKYRKTGEMPNLCIAIYELDEGL